MHLRIYATVYYPLSETEMLTICVIRQNIVTHLLAVTIVSQLIFSFFDQTLEQFDTRDKKCPTVSSFKKSLINEVNLLKPSRYY